MAIPRPHSQKEIKERREKMLLLMSKGLNHKDIAEKLNTTTQSVYRDMKAVSETTNRNLNDLARVTLSTMYENCITGLNEILKECWNIYKMKTEADNSNRNRLTWWHKIASLRLAAEVNDKKFNMLLNGPAVMSVRMLKDEVKSLEKELLLESTSTSNNISNNNNNNSGNVQAN